MGKNSNEIESIRRIYMDKLMEILKKLEELRDQLTKVIDYKKLHSEQVNNFFQKNYNIEVLQNAKGILGFTIERLRNEINTLSNGKEGKFHENNY